MNLVLCVERKLGVLHADGWFCERFAELSDWIDCAQGMRDVSDRGDLSPRYQEALEYFNNQFCCFIR